MTQSVPRSSIIDENPQAQGASAGQTTDKNLGGIEGRGFVVDPDKMIEAITAVVPTITYGTNSTMIKNISVKSEHDSNLSTIHMLRAGPGSTHVTPEGRGIDNVPLWTIPATMSVEAFGCPLIEYGQQFFVNLQTGTSIDNIYAATTIEHTIEQGKFDTSITWKLIDSYGSFRSLSAEMTAALASLEKRGIIEKT